METITMFGIFCVFIITVMSLYLPIAHIRLSNKILKHLEQIENNTRIDRAFEKLSREQS